ncbi:riboflavin kinase-domain-containing protein [Amylocarpus encephaloides]|uniref:Riboflavin kinase n=1 Tax=Amylocarpus encephaloides TaxID=45428 RepID=A0A9P7YG87_9HELO|nr:riboflavin kinase-domain-containing protein [Amylocarpus encephaloides]
MSESATLRAERPAIVGEESGPQPPFPRRMEGVVERGFDTISGVYFGWASLRLPSSNPDHSSPAQIPQHQLERLAKKSKFSPSDLATPPPTSSNWRVYPMVMSIGYNPFFANKERSAEVYIMNDFKEDFYGEYMRVSIAGYIRKELNYIDQESLINDINTDVDVALASLGRKNWGVGNDGEWLSGKGWTPELAKAAASKVADRAAEKAQADEAEAEKSTV